MKKRSLPVSFAPDGHGGGRSQQDLNEDERKQRAELVKSFDRAVLGTGIDYEDTRDVSYSICCPCWNTRLLLRPQSRPRFVWDLLLIMITLFICFELPFRAAFLSTESSSEWAAYDWFVDSCFLLDIVINFRTGFQDEAGTKVIMSPWLIAKRYLKGWFFVDLLSTIPFEKILCLVQSCRNDPNGLSSIALLRAAKVTKLLRLLRVTRIFRYLERWESLAVFFSSDTMRVIKLISVMTIFAHWAGCMHFLVAVLEGMPADSWPVRSGASTKDAGQQYVMALFNSVSQMLSIGYGIVPPVRQSEVMMVLFMMIIGATLYGLFVASLTSFLADLDASAKQYSSNLDMLNQYMKHQQLPQPLRVKMRNYLELCFPHKRAFREDEIMNSLTLPLRQQVCWHKCARVLERLPLHESVEPGLMGAMSLALKRVVYVQGDYILREGELGCNMFFIAAGEVQVVTGAPQKHVEVTRLREGDFFGEMALLDNAERHMASVRVVTFCDGFCMSRSAYLGVSRDYPSVKQYLESLRPSPLDL